ncbi:Biosynthetic Aromatic amino acid aminotransferase beta @ Histidinol-phosphate aminotransferase [hydrothermal vent metagenome]|uniref:Biosynthetic Aromatic amino acid aminotransferase beta @ Histidinol-phosphate aminotransferase n=1 Tax=hydrothermal vent metagenome TaxID=652676 RepID=A0A3B0TA14_9ZZZZ
MPKPSIMKITPYVPGRSSPSPGLRTEPGLKTIKLSSNESALGASPKAIAALDGLGGVLAHYPDGSSGNLRAALAQTHGLEENRIVIGAGSDEILHLLAQIYIGEGDEAIVSEFGFLVYPIITRGAGGEPVFVSDKDYRVDVEAILDAVTKKTRVVFVANPNNPTGTYLSASEMGRLHRGLRDDILLVIDNAYAEYVSADDYQTGAELAHTAQNVVMVRTFSKIGLAALRIGWMYGPATIIDAVNRLRGPFNVNYAAQLAGVAAVQDHEFTARLKAHNSKWRRWLSDQLASNEIRVLPSQGNFILAIFTRNGTAGAKKAFQALSEKGLVVREMGAYGLADALRISIGDEEAMKRVAVILRDLTQA